MEKYIDIYIKGGNSITKLSELLAGLGYVWKQVKIFTFQGRAFWDIAFLVPSTPLPLSHYHHYISVWKKWSKNQVKLYLWIWCELLSDRNWWCATPRGWQGRTNAEDVMYAICEEAVSRYTNEKHNYAMSCNFDQIFGKLGSDWGPLGDRWVM